MRLSSLAVLLLVVSPALVRADVPPPLPKEPTYPLTIDAQPRVLEARLIIPAKMLGKMKAALEEAENGTRLAENETPRLHTIMAGSALALSLTFCGLWLVRRGHVSGRALTVLLGTVAFLGIGAMVWADRRPAPNPAQRGDRVIIEIVEKGEEVKLIVNKAKLAKALEEKK